MANLTKAWKNFSAGWFGQTERHRAARLYGHAGGKYKKKYLQVKQPIPFSLQKPVDPNVREKIITQTFAKLDEKTKLDDAAKIRLGKEALKEADEPEIKPKPMPKTKKKEEILSRTVPYKAVGGELAAQARTAMRTGMTFDEWLDGTAGNNSKVKQQILNAIGYGEVAGLRKISKDAHHERLLTTKVFRKADDTVKKTFETVAPQYRTPAERLKEMQDKQKIDKLREDQKRTEDVKAREMFITGGDNDPLSIQNAGIFDPLGNLGVSGEVRPLGESFEFGQDGIGPEPEAASPGKKEMFPFAYQTERLVNDYYDSIPDFTENNTDSFFDDGEDAFKRGDRDKLVSSIIDVGYEQRKLEDRKHYLDTLRSKVLNDQNVVESLHKEDEGSDILPSSIFGGAIGSHLNDQMKKIAEIEKNLYVQINKASARQDNLRKKLTRLDTHTDYAQFEPQMPKKVMAFGRKDNLNIVDVDNPTLSEGNIGISFFKDLKNPLFGSENK